VSKNPEIRDDLFLKRKPELLKTLLHSCLFEIPNSHSEYTDIMPPRAKSSESRKAVYTLLKRISQEPGELMERVVDYLKGPMVESFWRTPLHNDWFIVPSTSERSVTGFVGLKNQSATCYQNALLQQFFMIPDFRETMLTIEDPPVANPKDMTDNQCLFKELKTVFGALKVS
jgi:hypothetical protein